jgi:hypothetical protein
MDNQPERVSDIDLSWLAGVWESEGYFSLTRIQRKNNGRDLHTPKCGVTNSDVNMIGEIHKILVSLDVHHWISPGRIHGLSKKPTQDIIVQGLGKCKKITSILIPFLRTKQDRAKLVNVFCESRLLGAGRAIYNDKEKYCCGRLRTLNGRSDTILREQTLTSYNEMMCSEQYGKPTETAEMTARSKE